jgi:phosphoglycolate phosphatase-like HAD superfamily hydrolase
MKNTIICDIDGTIADLTHRLHHIHPSEGQRKNWAAFHAGVKDDTPHHDMHFILWALVRSGMRVIYVSGRNEASRKDTEAWLNREGFPNGMLYMRADGDFRNDAIIKEEILDNHLRLTPEDVLCVLDDRQRVVDMWRRRGFRVLQVAPGDF